MRRLIVIAAAVLAACSTFPRADSVRIGEAPDQVRARLGTPGAQRKLATGEDAWYYLTGPAGFETWRVVFGADGKVKAYTQVLTQENLEWVRTGATRPEVLDRIGPPMEMMRFARTNTDAWTYRYQFGTLKMIGQPVFNDTTGKAEYVGIFLDPAYYSSVGSLR
jgi:outer membrane protein assembly factor BamE (lipoprotein component of BamABCDE complex)